MSKPPSTSAAIVNAFDNFTKVFSNANPAANTYALMLFNLIKILLIFIPVLYLTYLYMYVMWLPKMWFMHRESKFYDWMEKYVVSIIDFSNEISSSNSEIPKSYEEEYSSDINNFYKLLGLTNDSKNGDPMALDRLVMNSFCKEYIEVDEDTKELKIKDVVEKALLSNKYHNDQKIVIDNVRKILDSLADLKTDFPHVQIIDAQEAEIHSTIKGVLTTKDALWKGFEKAFEKSLASERELKDVPEFHVLFHFYDEIAASNNSAFGKLLPYLEEMSAPGSFISIVSNTYYEPKSTSKNEINDEVMKKYTDVHKLLVDYTTALHDVAKAINKVQYRGFKWNKVKLNCMILDLYLNPKDGYVGHRNKKDTITRISYMRKPGNWSHFSLFMLYTADTIDFCFKEKIVGEIWGVNGELFLKVWMVKETERIRNALTSPGVMNFFLTLPNKIAGVDPQNKTVVQEENNKPVDQEDVVEPFVGQLIKIANVFAAIGKVLVSITNVISDPVKFLLFLIGWIVAIILLCLYTVAATIIMVALVYVWVFFILVFKSAWWLIILTVNMTVYLILGILDMVLQGFLLKLMTCENLPNSWHAQHGWHKFNRYTRGIMCTFPCRKNFFRYGMFCVRQNKDLPTYAPQQIIFESLLNNKFISENRRRCKLEYKHEPVKDYYTQWTDDMRKELWSTVYHDRIDYSKSTRDSYKRYDKITEGICCVAKQSMDDKDENKSNILEICNSVYCVEARNKNKTLCGDSTSFIDNVQQGDVFLTILKCITVVCIILMAINVTATADFSYLN